MLVPDFVLAAELSTAVWCEFMVQTLFTEYTWQRDPDGALLGEKDNAHFSRPHTAWLVATSPPKLARISTCPLRCSARHDDRHWH